MSLYRYRFCDLPNRCEMSAHKFSPSRATKLVALAKAMDRSSPNS